MFSISLPRRRLPRGRYPGLVPAAIVMAAVWFLGSAAASADSATMIRSGPGDRARIALTFDDNYNTYRALAVMSVLRRYDAKATMFLTGHGVTAYPEISRAVLAGGFEVGDHSMSHALLTRLSWSSLHYEIGGGTDRYRAQVGGTTAPLHRPPYGAVNSRVIDAAGAEGFRYVVLWDIDTNDWRGYSSSYLTNHVLSRAHNGAIVLMHLTGPNTAAALPGIITGLRARGYELVTISELMNIPPPAPKVSIGSPLAGATIRSSSHLVQGTAQGGAAGAAIAKVEVSLDDGATWRPAAILTGKGTYQATWSYLVAFSPGSTQAKLKARATDTGGRIGVSGSVAATFVYDSAAHPVYRTFFGRDRYATAILVSRTVSPAGASTIVLVKGDDYSDALAAAPLAAAYGGPVILTPSAGLTREVGEELARLDPDLVFFVGLAEGVKAGIEAAVPDAEIRTVRGDNRYDTAALLAAELVAKIGPVDTVVLASGNSFPDALSVAPLAAAQGWPILLTPQAGPLPPVTATAIEGLGATSALVVGTYVKPPAFVTGVIGKVGTDRYHTSALIAAYAESQGSSFAQLALATGQNYPDALVVGPHLAAKKGVLLLTRPEGIPQPILDLLDARAGVLDTVDIVGGLGVIEAGMWQRFRP